MILGNRKWIVHFFSIFITIILLIFLLSSINITSIIETLSNVNKYYLIIGFFIYAITYLLRAIRFKVLLVHPIPFLNLFSIVCIHNMATNILPLKSGELSYIYLVRKFQNIRLGEAIATLLVARIFDLISIIPLFILSFIFLEKYSYSNQNIAPLLALMLILIIILMLSLFKYGKTVFRTMHSFYIKSRFYDLSFLTILLLKGRDMIEALESIKTRNILFFGEIVLISLSIWISIFLLNYVLILSLGLNLDFLEVMFASTFGICATMLPIQGVLGFGTFELGWMIGFITIGLSSDSAISTGFSYHIIIISYFLILGLFGVFNLLIMRYSRNSIVIK